MKTQKYSCLLLLPLGFTILYIITLREPLLYLGNRIYDVRIINGFSNNSSLPLVVWCVTEDKGDIGGRALQERDDYSWFVETGLFSSSSRFICTLKWDDRRKKFEAFRASRDRYKCGDWGKCFWLVKEDGFYFSNNEVNWSKQFSWM